MGTVGYGERLGWCAPTEWPRARGQAKTESMLGWLAQQVARYIYTPCCVVLALDQQTPEAPLACAAQPYALCRLSLAGRRRGRVERERERENDTERQHPVPCAAMKALSLSLLGASGVRPC